jgi:ATP-dependent Clp protease protease subunit
MELEELFSGLDRYGLDPVTYQYFHQLLERRTVLLNYDVSDDIVERVYLPLKEFEDDDSNEPVTLILNSSGGSVSDGFFLAHYISQYSKPLNILVPGYACSMAAVILAGGGKNENVIRSCFPCSYALIHDGYVALAASESKTAADIMAFNDKVDEQIKDFIVKNTNITKEEYDSHMRHQWFLYADDMLEKGLIDRIIGVTEE